MPGTPDPTGRPSSAKHAAPVPAPTDRPPDDLPLPPTNGSTGSHNPVEPVPEEAASANNPVVRSAESDIAQFLAHPQGGGANTDDSPTVITNNRTGSSGPHPTTTPPPVRPVTLAVNGEPPSIAGRKLGHFELIEAVGSGGMAAVLKARDTELGRIVALKILPPEAARDPESVSRFKQEARAAAKLDHDNVARVYFCGEDQGLHFIAFEFVEGDNLRVIIDRRGPLSAVECVPYMMQIAAGLNHAAERGVVHRDIKPSNILITPDGRAKIVDMGLARHLGSDTVNGGVTQSGVTLGTFDYISPEQALDPRRADVRSDIYSLGCTFYHALTGRPPVPEGTAARKLRAHQNDEPLDPRELNPNIPDELAAILARMMAKNPDDRYQSPTELIAHLKGMAERLKIRTDPLAHDTATKSVPAELRLLPEAPRVRPWWLVAIAAIALAIVAFVIATNNPGPAPGRPVGPDQTKKTSDPLIDTGKPPGKTPDPAPAGAVTTAEQLAARLEDPNTTGKVQVQLAPGTFDLSQFDRPIAFQGKELELVGAPGGLTKVILNASHLRGAEGTVTVKANAITVRNVWFDLRLDPDVTEDFGPNVPLFGLQFDEVSTLNLTDCVFSATHDKLQSHAPRSVAVTRPVSGQSKISALRCLFTPGAVGVFAPTGTVITLTDCGFAPHAAAVLLDSANGTGELPQRTEVNLDRSSFMLNHGESVVETGTPVSVKVTASDCLFAPVGPGRPAFASSEANRRGVVVRVRGEKPDGVELAAPVGHTNAYYDVDPLGTQKDTLTFDECKTQGLEVADKSRTDLKQRPWSERDPQTTVAAETNPWKAFRLKVDTDPAVFALVSTRTGKQWVPVGVAFYDPTDLRSPWRAYPDVPVWPPTRQKTALEAATKVWYPSAKTEELAPGEYNDLRALLKAARPDDTILIRHNGELAVDSEEIKAATKPSDGDVRVTFMPHPDSNPVLVSQGGVEYDRSLFKLKSGEVTFVGLHFQLKPTRARNEVVAAVAILGGRSCTFRNCLFTLAEKDDAPAAAVYLPDAKKVMMMEPSARAPKVMFDHCLVRGKGRAVWVEVSRPVNLEMTHTITALDGPVLLTETGGTPGAGTSSAKFTRVTALVGGPLIEMRGGKAADAMRPTGLVKLEVESDRCLFAAVPGAGRPLVELDGVDPTDVKSVFTWRATEGSRYAGFDTSAELAVIRPGGDGMPKAWLRDDWISNVGEPPGADKRFGSITFASPIKGRDDLAVLKPTGVAPKTFEFGDLPPDKLLDVGADLNGFKKLPLPSDEPKPE